MNNLQTKWQEPFKARNPIGASMLSTAESFGRFFSSTFLNFRAVDEITILIKMLYLVLFQ